MFCLESTTKIHQIGKFCSHSVKNISVIIKFKEHNIVITKWLIFLVFIIMFSVIHGIYFFYWA